MIQWEKNLTQNGCKIKEILELKVVYAYKISKLKLQGFFSCKKIDKILNVKIYFYIYLKEKEIFKNNKLKRNIC